MLSDADFGEVWEKKEGETFVLALSRRRGREGLIVVWEKKIAGASNAEGKTGDGGSRALALPGSTEKRPRRTASSRENHPHSGKGWTAFAGPPEPTRFHNVAGRRPIIAHTRLKKGLGREGKRD